MPQGFASRSAAPATASVAAALAIPPGQAYRVRSRLAAGGRWIRTPGPGSKGRRFRRTTEGAGAFERTVCGWDREFESPLLQRGVGCELDFLNHGRRRPFVCHDMAFGIL